MQTSQQKSIMPSKDQVLAGRQEVMSIENRHYVHARPIKAPFSDDDTELAQVIFGLGCFWGAERAFWGLNGVYTTAVGYGAGITPNPTYQEVCSGLTGHNELVLVVYKPELISLQNLLKVFFESHNPTQGMRQGNDVGTQYRSGIYFLSSSENKKDFRLAEKAKMSYQEQLINAGHTQVTTELQTIKHFYYAEDYHQQYLAKNPNGYCGLGGVGIQCNLSD